MAKSIEIDHTDFRPYRQLAQIRSRAPNYPTDNDVDTLMMALTYAPQVTGLRMQAIDALTRRGKLAEAAVLLGVLQSQPHAAPEEREAGT